MNKALKLVIDADIARSAGTSEHPISSSARRLLENVRNNGHYVAMCPDLLEEWKKHRSLFARRWLASMVAKKKVTFIKPDSKVRDYIANHVTDSKIKSITIKDAHLVDAALSQSQLIASNDNNARNAFCSISADYRGIATVMWFHSMSDKEFIADFLQSVCFVPEHYYLVSIRSVGPAETCVSAMPFSHLISGGIVNLLINKPYR